MSNRLLVPRQQRIATPALILRRDLLFYRGRWDGPGAFAGRFLVGGRAGREWLDIQTLLDGGWDGQPATAMLAVTHLIGFGVGASRIVIPGSQTWTANGSHDVTDYDRLEVAVWGGGGSGGGVDAGGEGGFNGSNGNLSRYASSTNVQGNGGGGGGGSSFNSNGSGGSGGTASGGDTNTTGSAGTSGTTSSGDGGAAASGSGTLLGTLTGGGTANGRSNNGNGANGNTIGGGGAGGKFNNGDAGGGGGGGLAVKLWLGTSASGAPQIAESITVTVGGTRNSSGDEATGGTGARGEVRAQWD